MRTAFNKKKTLSNFIGADNKSIKATNFLDFIQYSDGKNIEKISLLIKVDIKKVKIIYKNLKKYGPILVKTWKLQKN